VARAVQGERVAVARAAAAAAREAEGGPSAAVVPAAVD
jgi:hypothetical protein